MRISKQPTKVRGGVREHGCCDGCPQGCFDNPAEYETLEEFKARWERELRKGFKKGEVKIQHDE